MKIQDPLGCTNIGESVACAEGKIVKYDFVLEVPTDQNKEQLST